MYLHPFLHQKRWLPLNFSRILTLEAYVMKGLPTGLLYPENSTLWAEVRQTLAKKYKSLFKEAKLSLYPRPKWSAYSGHCRAPRIYTASKSGQLQCTLLIHWSSTLKLQGPWMCTEPTLQPTAVYFRSALNIPNSLRSVLHCRYLETTLNPHSTSMGVHSEKRVPKQ